MPLVSLYNCLQHLKYMPVNRSNMNKYDYNHAQNQMLDTKK